MPHLCAAAARMTELLPLELQAKCGVGTFVFSARDIEPDKKKNSMVSCKLRESTAIWWQYNELTSSPLICDTHTGVQSALLQAAGYYIFCHSNIHGNNLLWYYFAYINRDAIHQYRSVLTHSNAKRILILISVLILITFCACVLAELDQFSCSPTAHTQLSVLWENSH